MSTLVCMNVNKPKHSYNTAEFKLASWPSYLALNQTAHHFSFVIKNSTLILCVQHRFLKKFDMIIRQIKHYSQQEQPHFAVSVGEEVRHHGH